MTEKTNNIWCVKKSVMSQSILKRIEEEYEVILNYLIKTENPTIGFWTSIRMIMPIVEAAKHFESKKPSEILTILGVPEGETAWKMFRNSLVHSEVIFPVEMNGKLHTWAITFGKKHYITKSNCICLSTPCLLSKLKEYISKFENDDTLVSIKFK